MPSVIDLSLPFEHGQLNFAWDPKLSVIVHNTIATIGYNMTQISMGTHQGTHLDAPFHFYEDGKTVDQIPLDRFYGPAVLVDLAPGSQLEAKTPITPAMLEPYADRFQPGSKVIYRTGWDRAFGTPEYFADFPSLTIESARWLAEQDRSDRYGHADTRYRLERSALGAAGQGDRNRDPRRAHRTAPAARTFFAGSVSPQHQGAQWRPLPRGCDSRLNQKKKC